MPAMESSLAQRLKPAAPASVHLLLAGVMWTVVGALLVYFGSRWVLESWPGPGGWAGAVVAVAVGWAKSRWVLDRSAGRIADRIVARGDGRCLGGFLSWKTWGLVALMSGGGRLLRATVGAGGPVGLLYLAVGAALFRSSRTFWRERRRRLRGGGPVSSSPAGPALPTR